jgi:hypothetical protein
VSRTVTVAPPASNGPPAVVITAPHQGAVLDYNVGTYLYGNALDPDGGPIVSYRWTVVNYSGTEIEIRPPAPNPAFTWTPAWPTLPFKCGGYSILLRLYATDGQGQTGVGTITLYVLMPVC